MTIQDIKKNKTAKKNYKQNKNQFFPSLKKFQFSISFQQKNLKSDTKR